MTLAMSLGKGKACLLAGAATNEAVELPRERAYSQVLKVMQPSELLHFICPARACCRRATQLLSLKLPFLTLLGAAQGTWLQEAVLCLQPQA